VEEEPVFLDLNVYENIMYFAELRKTAREIPKINPMKIRNIKRYLNILKEYLRCMQKSFIFATPVKLFIDFLYTFRSYFINFYFVFYQNLNNLRYPFSLTSY